MQSNAFLRMSDEMSGQMRRAAVSVPSNVAEGHATGLRKRYRHHVRISLGSLGGLITCVELARRLDYLSNEEADRLQADMERTSQLLHGVLRSIRLQLAAKGIVGILLLTFAYSIVR